MTSSITQKTKELITFVVLAVVIATAFFIHMSIPPIPKEYKQAKANWEVLKSKNTKALNAIKQLNFDLHKEKITTEEFLQKQPALVEAYSKINTEKNEFQKIALEIKSEAKFLHFKSFQFFLGEIGWAAGLFLYALVNLFNTFYLKNRYIKREFTGKILLHSTLLFVGCFYIAYVFHSELDFAKIWYFIAMAFCAITLVFASKFIMNTYLKRTEYLRENIDRLITFIFRIRAKHYREVSAKALYAEERNVILDEENTVEDNNNTFEEDFYETLEKIEI